MLGMALFGGGGGGSCIRTADGREVSGTALVCMR